MDVQAKGIVVCSTIPILIYSRCMAASVLLPIGNQTELIDLIVKKASLLKPGQEGKDAVGPVIDRPSLDKIVSYINDSEKSGAKVLLDGRKWLKNEALIKSKGYWIGPTVLLHSNPSDKALHDEIFGTSFLLVLNLV